jgi:hypothetical protein
LHPTPTIDGKTDAGVKLMEQTRIYSLTQKDNPPVMKFPNASAVASDYDFKRDLRYFESLRSSSTTNRSRPKTWRCAAWLQRFSGCRCELSALSGAHNPPAPANPTGAVSTCICHAQSRRLGSG